MRRCTALSVMVVGVMVTAAHADWPQFLGPQQDASSPAQGLITRWPEGGPELLWTVDLGPGFGGAAIRDGKVYILDRNGEDGDALRVLDLKQGNALWRFEYAARGRLSHEGSRSTPTVTDTHVYTVGGFGDVYCIDLKTHQPVWNLNLNQKFKESRANWGFAQSPLVYKDTLIVSPLDKESPGLVALNKDTGEVVWESQAFGGDYYSSPVLRTVAGTQGVMIITNDRVAFVDPDSGKLLWQFIDWFCKWSIPSPTVLPDGQHIFVTGGYGAGSVMIRVTKQGSGFHVAERYRMKQDGCQLHPAVYYKGHLYANINENDKLKRGRMQEGGLACIDPATGKILWRTGEKPNFDRGSLLLVGDKILIQEGQNGELALVQPDPRGYRELARAKIFNPRNNNGNDIWAPMAISDGLLVLRDQSQIKCIRVGTSSKLR